MSQPTPSRPVMLITGASRGIGKAVALKAAAAGHDLCLNYVSDQAAAEAVQTACQALGANTLLCRADVGHEPDVMSMFEQIDQRFGALQCLVNNAGLLGRSMKFADYTHERIEKTIRTNVIGAILCAREAVRRMSTRLGGQGGSIVNLSSRAACLGSPDEFIDYAASKGAIDTLTIGLSKELGGEGIRVNAVRPGLINTDIHASAGDAARVDRLSAGVPMARSGEPEEVANAVLWLASAEATYVSGTFIDVSGGR